MSPEPADRVETPLEPRGSLASRVLAMPADTNPSGDIFGGWIMSFMDAAGAMAAAEQAQCRVVTVAATDMAFLQPVKVGDTVCCYARLSGSAGRRSPFTSRCGSCAMAAAGAER